MAGGANHSRLTSITYASGYVLNYNYGTGLDSTISRLTSLSDSGNTLESYSYLGLATIVKRAHAQSGVDLSYIKLTGESVGDAGDQYNGLDRFQRIVDQRWINGSNVDVDRFKYGYDRNGNRLFKDNVVIASLSEVYTYDDLNQLASYKLGTLNTGKTDVTGTATNAQSWDYDAVGNWDSVTTNSTTQTRGANRQNEITSVSGATTPTYDNNGNLTKDENDNRFVWDAWNREVKIKNSSNTVIATNAYDGLNHKVQVTTGAGLIDKIFGKNEWQVFEEKNGSNTLNRYVWSPVYVDGLVTRNRDTDGNGTLDDRLFALQDGNWNTTGLVNTSGIVVERETYGPYGGVTYRDASGSVISTSAKEWVFLHQGGERIAAGDYEFRNRVLSPTLGRWLSNDPIGFSAGDVNTFRYVENGPGNGLDSKGLKVVKITLSGINIGSIFTNSPRYIYVPDDVKDSLNYFYKNYTAGNEFVPSYKLIDLTEDEKWLIDDFGYNESRQKRLSKLLTGIGFSNNRIYRIIDAGYNNKIKDSVIDNIIIKSEQTWCFPFLPGHCLRWTDEFTRRLCNNIDEPGYSRWPLYDTGLTGSVVNWEINKNFGLTDSHAGYQIVFPDKTKFYIDNGSASGNHITPEDNLDPNLKNLK